MWESTVKGFLLSTNDFTILSKDGVNLLTLGDRKSRVVMDSDKNPRKIHSLG